MPTVTPVKNLDTTGVETKARVAAVVSALMDSKSKPEEIENALLEMAQATALEIYKDHSTLTGNQMMDGQALAARGINILTSSEHEYFTKLGEAFNASDPASIDLSLVMPKTEVDRVFEDLEKDSELLSVIQFVPTEFATEWLINKDESQLAQWGAIDAEISKKLSSGFEKIQTNMLSLTAYIPIAKAMVDLGPAWLEKYVRIMLKNAIILACEKEYVLGDGKLGPIGMIRDLKGNVVEGVYPEKSKIKMNSMDPVAYSSILAKLIAKKNESGKVTYRKLTEVIMIVNPIDYIEKIFPCTTVRSADGTYRNDIFPFPTKPIQSEFIDEGTAIIGLPSRYFANLGTGKDGNIEFSDHFKFLQRERIYATFLYGGGRPLDNDSFVVVDISDMKPFIQEVKVVGTVETKSVTTA